MRVYVCVCVGGLKLCVCVCVCACVGVYLPAPQTGQVQVTLRASAGARHDQIVKGAFPPADTARERVFRHRHLVRMFVGGSMGGTLGAHTPPS